MKKIIFSLIMILWSIPATAQEISFSDILKRVTLRDERTGAILEIAASAAEKESTGESGFSSVELTPAGDEIRIYMYNTYMTGHKEVVYYFSPETSITRELQKYEHFLKLKEFDADVANAERRRRIYVYSNFQFMEGAPLEEVERVFGKDYKTEPWQKAGWATLIFEDYFVTMAVNQVHDIEKTAY